MGTDLPALRYEIIGSIKSKAIELREAKSEASKLLSLLDKINTHSKGTSNIKPSNGPMISFSNDESKQEQSLAIVLKSYIESIEMIKKSSEELDKLKLKLASIASINNSSEQAQLQKEVLNDTKIQIESLVDKASHLADLSNKFKYDYNIKYIRKMSTPLQIEGVKKNSQNQHYLFFAISFLGFLLIGIAAELGILLWSSLKAPLTSEVVEVAHENSTNKPLSNNDKNQANHESPIYEKRPYYNKNSDGLNEVVQ